MRCHMYELSHSKKMSPVICLKSYFDLPYNLRVLFLFSQCIYVSIKCGKKSKFTPQMSDRTFTWSPSLSVERWLRFFHGNKQFTLCVGKIKFMLWSWIYLYTYMAKYWASVTFLVDIMQLQFVKPLHCRIHFINMHTVCWVWKSKVASVQVISAMSTLLNLSIKPAFKNHFIPPCSENPTGNECVMWCSGSFLVLLGCWNYLADL